MRVKSRKTRKIFIRRDSSFQKSYTDVKGYDDNMKIVIVFLKVVGAIPIHKNQRGEWKFSVMSGTFLYAVFIYLVLVVASAISYMKYVDYFFSFNNLTFYDYLDIGWCLAQKFPVLGIPIITWPEARKVANFLNGWKELQIRYRMSGIDVSLNSIFRHSLAWLILISAVEIVKDILLYTLVKWGATFKLITILHYISYIVPGVLNQVLVLFWSLTCKGFTEAGKTLVFNFKQEMVNTVSVQKLIHYHSLWLELSRLYQNMGAALCYTYCFCFLYLFILETIAIYFIIGEIKVPSGWWPMLSIDMIVLAASIFFLCSSSYGSEMMIGSEFKNLIIALNLSVQNDTIKEEIREFLTTIQNCPPEISLGGYFTVNRSLVVSLGAMMVTYLVIILQFDLSANIDSKPNSETILTTQLPQALE